MKRSTRTNMMMGSMKAVTLVGLGLGLMGNQSCEQKQTATPARQLKWYAEAGKITSPVVDFGDAGSFDLGYVASEQLYGVLYNSDGFTTGYNGPGILISNSGVELAGAQTMYKKMFGTTSISSQLYYSDEARCLINIPDVKVQGAITSFAVTAGNGYSVGFNQSGVQAGVGLGAQYAVTTKAIQVQMYGLDSAKTLDGKTQVIAAPLVNYKAKDTSGKVNISYNLLSGGYSWYKNTAIASMTEAALTSGITTIKNKMNEVKWTTKVLDLQTLDNSTSNPLGDVGVVIKGGADVNLKAGDQVAFYNEKTVWSGKPCESDYKGFARFAKEPFAYGEVIFADRYFSTVAITKRLDNTKILPGWRVELFKKIEDVKAEEAAAAAAAKKTSSAKTASVKK